MRNFVLFLTVVCFTSAVRAADDDDLHYEAVWLDGTREAVKAPLQWVARETAPQLAGKPVLEGSKRLRRLHQIGSAVPSRVTERVELIGGDRLTGRIVSYLPESTEGHDHPASLVVEPQPAVDEPIPDEPARVRVPIERLRRVVWSESTPRPFRPGTFFYRDGRRTTFRSLRWGAESLRLLVEQGVEEVAWDDAAEIHLPARDPWEEYADQLAIVAPEGPATLVAFETPGGTRVTTPLGRLRATGDVNRAESQTIALQPAWSLDPIVLPQRLIAAATFFAEHELPLSNYEPSAFVHRPVLGGGWNQWRADQNVQGGLLGVDDAIFGWGFGVHAYATLEFDLPPWARGFRTGAALDRAAGDGGCVRARIYFGPLQTAAAVTGRPLYESPLIIGSTKPHDSGRLELRPVPGRPNRLVLQCDSLAGEAVPPQADPLDLRDLFDWLEPIVDVDPAMLRAAVNKHAASLFVREHHWVVQGSYGEAWRWDQAWVGSQRRRVVTTGKGPLVLTRTLTFPAECEAVIFPIAALGEASGPVIASLRVGDKAIGGARVAGNTDPARPRNVLFAIPAELRGREQRCELSFTAEKAGMQIDFYGLMFHIPPPPATK